MGVPQAGCTRGVGLVGVPASPVGEQAERAGEFGAFGGELVGGARRPLGVGPGYQQPVAFKPLEAVGQDVRGDARDLAEQVVEPARPGQQRLHHQQRPPVARLWPVLRRAVRSRARVQPWANLSPVGALMVDSGLQVTIYLEGGSTMTILDEVGASIRQLAESAGASVVGIGQRRGAGSGIVLGERPGADQRA